MTTLLDRRPEHLPPGYTLRYTLSGGKEPGLGWVDEQTVLVYTLGWERDDFTMPLVVCVGRPEAPDLVGTSVDYGEEIDIAVPGVRAVYHDGIQAPRLDDAREFAGLVWQRGGVHSVTARSTGGTFAVRGPRSLPREELLATLVSLSPDR